MKKQSILDMIPDGQAGDWKIQTFTISEGQAKVSRFRAIINGHGRGGVAEGTYRQLSRNGTVVMSNTPDELRDSRYFVNRATGSVLINGLGLGCIIGQLLEKEDVTEITVIEKSREVIRLVGKYYREDKRVRIIHGDAFKWQPPKGKVYDAVWHDIWDFITTDNLPEMHRLHRKYGRRAKYQESWCRWICEREKRWEKKHEPWYNDI
jgi:hypothetical protein